MLVNIDKGEKIKIKHIVFQGNEKLSDKKLRTAMKNTKQINPIRIFKASKFIKKKYDEENEAEDHKNISREELRGIVVPSLQTEKGKILIKY